MVGIVIINFKVLIEKKPVAWHIQISPFKQFIHSITFYVQVLKKKLTTAMNSLTPTATIVRFVMLCHGVVRLKAFTFDGVGILQKVNASFK